MALRAHCWAKVLHKTCVCLSGLLRCAFRPISGLLNVASQEAFGETNPVLIQTSPLDSGAQ